MDRTGTTYLVPERFARDEADQVQDSAKADRGSEPKGMAECPAWWRSSSPSLQEKRIPVGGFGAWRGNREEEEPVILFGVATRLMLACTLILYHVHLINIK